MAVLETNKVIEQRQTTSSDANRLGKYEQGLMRKGKYDSKCGMEINSITLILL